MTASNSSADPFHLQRFLAAQEPVYPQVCRELAAGQKRSHWMWFIFPQVQGLGLSSMAQKFAIGDLQEAQAYLQHPVLGARLRECASLVLAAPQRSVSEIFGYPDDLKFHSSMTLFSRAAEGLTAENHVFEDTIAQCFGGKLDAGTTARL